MLLLEFSMSKHFQMVQLSPPWSSSFTLWSDEIGALWCRDAVKQKVHSEKRTLLIIYLSSIGVFPTPVLFLSTVKLKARCLAAALFYWMKVNGDQDKEHCKSGMTCALVEKRLISVSAQLTNLIQIWIFKCGKKCVTPGLMSKMPNIISTKGSIM